MAARVSPSSWHPNHLCYTHVSVIVLVHTFKYIVTSVTQQCVRFSKLSGFKPSDLVPLSKCLDPYPSHGIPRKKNIKGIYFLQSKIILFVLFGVLLLYVTIQGSNLSACVITSTAGLRLLPIVNQNVALQRALM